MYVSASSNPLNQTKAQSLLQRFAPPTKLVLVCFDLLIFFLSQPMHSTAEAGRLWRTISTFFIASDHMFNIDQKIQLQQTSLAKRFALLRYKYTASSEILRGSGWLKA